MRVGFALVSLLVMTACETKSKSLPPLTIHRKLRWISGVTEHTVAFGVRGGFELADRESLESIGSGVGNLIHLREPATGSLVSDDPFPPTFEDIRSGLVTNLIVTSADNRYTVLNVPEPHHRVVGVLVECSANLCAFVWYWSADEPPTVETIDLATGASVARYNRPANSNAGSAHATQDITCYVYTTVSDSYYDHAVCEDMRTGKQLWQIDADGVSSLKVVVTKNYAVVLSGSGLRHDGFLAVGVSIHELTSGREMFLDPAFLKTFSSILSSEQVAVPYSDHLLLSTRRVRGSMGESPDISLGDVTEVDIVTGKVIGVYKHKIPPDVSTSYPEVVPIRPGHIALYGK
jgi:hypothetical protein